MTQVFVSWSGDQSRDVAKALSDWIPIVLQSVQPWISMDIEAGDRWSPEIAARLEASSFGIVCVTPSNLNEPWIHFEAGAVGKAVKSSKVVPYLLGMKLHELPGGPLAQFQAKEASLDGTKEMMVTLNSVLPEERRLDDARLKTTFDAFWPKLKAKLDEALSKAPPAPKTERTVPDMVGEILETVRRMERAATDSGTSFSGPKLAEIASALGYERKVPTPQMSAKEIRHVIARVNPELLAKPVQEDDAVRRVLELARKAMAEEPSE